MFVNSFPYSWHGVLIWVIVSYLIFTNSHEWDTAIIVSILGIMNLKQKEVQQDTQGTLIKKHAGEEGLKHRPLNIVESTIYYEDGLITEFFHLKIEQDPQVEIPRKLLQVNSLEGKWMVERYFRVIAVDVTCTCAIDVTCTWVTCTHDHFQ